jgi:hypothetical protein
MLWVHFHTCIFNNQRRFPKTPEDYRSFLFSTIINRRFFTLNFICLHYPGYLCITTGYGFQGWGSIPDSGKIVLFSIASETILRPTQPHIQWARGKIFLRIKRPGLEVDASPLSNAKVKNAGAIPPLPHMSSCHSA